MKDHEAGLVREQILTILEKLFLFENYISKAYTKNLINFIKHFKSSKKKVIQFLK